MRYQCEFPNCDYETNIRSQINKHHIVSKQQGGSNKEYNMIWLCPTHHTKIYIPECKKGIHSIKSEDSVIIHRWLSGTISSKILEYEINKEIK
jgi:hypothetical protein